MEQISVTDGGYRTKQSKCVFTSQGPRGSTLAITIHSSTVGVPGVTFTSDMLDAFQSTMPLRDQAISYGPTLILCA
jgi:hypothetical protein